MSAWESNKPKQLANDLKEDMSLVAAQILRRNNKKLPAKLGLFSLRKNVVLDRELAAKLGRQARQLRPKLSKLLVCFDDETFFGETKYNVGKRQRPSAICLQTILETNAEQGSN